MEDSILPPCGVRRKQTTVPNAIQDEMRIEAVAKAVWLALYEAQQAGLDDAVDGLGCIYERVRRQLSQLREGE